MNATETTLLKLDDISQHYHQWLRQRSKGAMSFEVRTSSSQVTRMHFSSSKKLTFKIKQIKWSAVRYGKISIFCSHYYRSKAKQ